MNTASTTQRAVSPRRQAQILARSLYKEMGAQGFGPEQIIAVSSMLLEMVHEEMSGHQQNAAALHAAE